MEVKKQILPNTMTFKNGLAFGTEGFVLFFCFFAWEVRVALLYFFLKINCSKIINWFVV